MKVFEAEDGSPRYAIHNENTGKTTNYRVWILPASAEFIEANPLRSLGVKYRWEDRARD